MIYAELEGSLSLKTLNIAVFAILLVTPFYSLSQTCDEAKKMKIVPSESDNTSAASLYANERRNGSPYRSKEDIAIMLAKVRHIGALSKACDVPIREIDANKYFELTGKLLF